MKRILITGNFGNLGTAAERLFTGAGWEVVGASRRSGIQLLNWVLVKNFIAEQKPFDIVLMAHGTQKKVAIAEYNEYHWETIFENNLKSAVILSKSLLKAKKLNPGALVVYCSSIQATQPRAGRGLYAMAKSGLETLARSMAVEAAPEVRAMTLRLGQMEAQMEGPIFSEDEQREIKSRTPLPWVGFEDTARLVMNLYEQPSLSGEVFEISSLHKFSIWPE